MAVRSTRQPDLFSPDLFSPDLFRRDLEAATATGTGLSPLPEVSEAERAEALAEMTRELEEVEASPHLPCRHDTSRAMGKEMSFKGRLWLLHKDDAARLLTRWQAAWARHWEVWNAEP
jgi:hypothetical protein